MTDQTWPKRLPAQPVQDFHGAFGHHHARAVHIGEVGDRVDDPSVAWPDDRPLVHLGVITINTAGPNTQAADRSLAFLPGTLPPGIGIADPMVGIRNAAYPVSFHERQ